MLITTMAIYLPMDKSFQNMDIDNCGHEIFRTLSCMTLLHENNHDFVSVHFNSFGNWNEFFANMISAINTM